jgi:hypothetical protein
MAAPTESDAPEAWDFLEVLSSPGSGMSVADEPVRFPGAESRSEVVDLLDWLARFTRNHFDRSIRNLHAARAGRDYILQRMREYSELRRRLATLCVEAPFHTPEQAITRIRVLCLELLIDAEAHAEKPFGRN